MSFYWSGETVTVVKHKMCQSVQECQHVSAISLTTKTENRKQIGFLRTTPHIDFSSLLSHCSTVSQLLRYRGLHGSDNKM